MAETRGKKYDGPVCYVGQDDTAADGHEIEGGWHYTVVEVPGVEAGGPDESPPTMPGEKLVLDHETGEYRLAKDGDQSWFERHHQRYNVVAPGGNIGIPHDADAVAATEEHLDRLEQRLGGDGLHDHEADHILTTPDSIAHARAWLSTHPARQIKPVRSRLRSVD